MIEFAIGRRKVLAGLRLALAILLVPGICLLALFAQSPGQGSQGNRLQGAIALSVDPAGNVYVLDRGTNELVKLSAAGKILARIGGYGWAPQTFDAPSDLIAPNGLDVYVADYGNHRIQRFDRNLNYVSSFDAVPPEGGDRRFGFPKSVAVSDDGALFIVDGENRQILKLTSANEVDRTFGGIGSGEGQLENPSRIRIEGNEQVYVQDGSSLIVYDVYGNYLKSIGRGLFRELRTFAVSGRSLFVLDSTGVRMFDENGTEASGFALESVGQSVDPSKFRDFAVRGDSLYILTDQALTVRALPSPLR